MTKVDRLRAELRSLDDWVPYLLAHSGLPGPRANIELAQAAADEGDARQLRELASLDAKRAPTGTPREFLTFFGVIGLGRLAADGDAKAIAELRTHASDPRWRCGRPSRWPSNAWERPTWDGC